MQRLVTFALVSLVAVAALAQDGGSSTTRPTSQPASNLHVVDPLLEGYAKVLTSRVDATSGLVDYRGLAASAQELSALDAFARAPLPRGASADAALAGRINRYNARVLHEVARGIARFEAASNGVLSQSDFFTRAVALEGRAVSLNDYEADIRKTGVSAIHFGVNCGSLGCPRLAAEPFREATVRARLDELERAGIRETTRVSGGKVEVIELFDWYGKDFTGLDPKTDAAKHLAAVRGYVLARLGSDAKSEQIRKAFTSGATLAFRSDWDWHVNVEASTPTKSK